MNHTGAVRAGMVLVFGYSGRPLEPYSGQPAKSGYCTSYISTSARPVPPLAEVTFAV
jgi:hypothetical protein